MNDTTKICFATVAVFAILFGVPAGCTMHQNARMAEAIKAGVDPIKVACAFRSGGNEPMCMAAMDKP